MLGSIQIGDVALWLVFIGMLVLIAHQMTIPTARAYYQSGEFGVVVALHYVAMTFWVAPRDEHGGVFSILVHGFVAGGAAFGTVLIVLGTINQVWGDPIGHLVSRIRQWRERRAQQRAAAEAQKARELQEQLEREEFERTRPEREARERAQARQQAAREAAERRREQIRFDVKLYYDRYRSELKQTFPPKVFAAYLSDYLTENASLDVLQTRAEQVKDMIRDQLQLNAESSERGFDSIEQVIEFFDVQRKRIEAMQGVDGEILEELLIMIGKQQDKAVREYLKP